MSLKRKIGLILLVMVVLLGAAAGYMYVHIVQDISNNGLVLTPSKDYAVKEVAYYLQGDPAWGADMIGASDTTMAAYGCFIACVASAATDLGIEITPKELNKRLTAVQGFQSDNVIGSKITEALPEIDYRYRGIFSARTIESDLENGLLPMVNVRYKGKGGTHWVLVAGAKDGEFLVYDPLNREQTMIPLSTHGTVYAYRVMVKR